VYRGYDGEDFVVIAGIKGIIEDVEPDALLVDVGGVVLRVFTPSSTSNGLSGPGDSVSLHTHLQMKEDGVSLFGFGSKQELRIFQLLLTVTGVGPRIALALLSSMGVDDLVLAIVSEEIARLSSVPGVGKRIAGRIALELKPKVGQVEISQTAGEATSASEMLAALTALGYNPSEASSAIRAIPRLSGMSLEEGVREALKALSGRR
jgi:holliday junction DNA helicase RuvA